MATTITTKKEEAHAVKLIEVNTQGQFIVTKEGSEILNNISSLCNLVFIFGNARSGKSFLMNRLLACAQSSSSSSPSSSNLFKVLNSSLPCTKGVDISSLFIPHHTLTNNTSNNNSEDEEGKKQLSIHLKAEDRKEESGEINVGFVDVEGQGDAGEVHDTLLALPLLLTSKIVLFNHKGAPTVGYMLEKLGVLARAAQKVRAGLDDEEEAGEEVEEEEEDEEEGEKVEKQNTHENKTLFGHLHILFRDFSFEGDETSVLQQLLKLEHVPREKKTLGNSSNNNYNPTEAIRDRNQIRKLIKKNFASVHAWIFPQPATPDILKECVSDLSVDLISPKFLTVTKNLFETITQQTSRPRIFGGEKKKKDALTGKKICEIQHLLIENINKGVNVIDIPSVLTAMEKSRLQNAQEVAGVKLAGMFEMIEKKFPLSSKDLSEEISVALKASNEVFEKMTFGCTLETEIAATKENLTKLIQTKIKQLEKRNGKTVWNFVEKTLKLEALLLVENFRVWSADKMGSEEEEIRQGYNMFKKQQRERIAKTLSFLPQVFEHTEIYDDMLRAYDEKPESFLSVIIARNNSYILDIKAKKIQEESEKQLKELVNKNDILLNNAIKMQQDTIEKAKELEKQTAVAVAEREQAVKKSDENLSQLQDKNAKLLELARQRDVERVAKEKLAKQIAELEQEKSKAAEEKKLMEAKAAEMHVEGWLMKKGREWPFNWKKRYFRVEGGVLVYYRDQKCKERKGFLAVNSNSVVQMLDPRAQENKDKKFGIQVISDDRSIIFKPVDEGDVGAMIQKEWDMYLKFVAAGISRDSVGKPRTESSVRTTTSG